MIPGVFKPEEGEGHTGSFYLPPITFNGINPVFPAWEREWLEEFVLVQIMSAFIASLDEVLSPDQTQEVIAANPSQFAGQLKGLLRDITQFKAQLPSKLQMPSL